MKGLHLHFLFQVLAYLFLSIPALAQPIPYEDTITPIEQIAARAIPLGEAETVVRNIPHNVMLERVIARTDDIIAGLRNHVAALIAMYPEDDIMFLARDGELLYDVARMFYPEEASRFRLVNLSRGHLFRELPEKGYVPYDVLPQINRDYIEQLRLTRGRQEDILLADTGWFGSLQNAISQHTGKEAPRTHFVGTSNTDIPGSMVFAERAGYEQPMADEMAKLARRVRVPNDIPDLEVLPKEVKTSEGLMRKADGTISAVVEHSSDDIRAAARRIRQHFKASMERSIAQSPGEAQKILKAMRIVRIGVLNPKMLKTPAFVDLSANAVIDLYRSGISSFPYDLLAAERLNFGKPEKELSRLWSEYWCVVNQRATNIIAPPTTRPPPKFGLEFVAQVCEGCFCKLRSLVGFFK